MVFTLVRLRRSPGFGFLIWWLVADLIVGMFVLMVVILVVRGLCAVVRTVLLLLVLRLVGSLWWFVLCLVVALLVFLFVLFGWLGFRLVGIVWHLRGCFGF